MVLIRLVKVKEEDGRTTVYEYDAEDIRTASVTGGVRTEYITDREAVYSQVLVKTSYGKNVFGVYNEERERITYTYGAGLINERRTGGEVGYALGMEYLYNGQYGVSTGGNSQSLNRYCYVQGNPISLTDPFGLCPTRAEVYKNRALRWLHTALDVGGILFDGFDYVNVLLYHFEGRDTEAAITLLCLLPVMGNFLAIPVRLTLKLGSNAGEALVKLGKKYFPDAIENGSRFLNWAGGKIDDVWRWIQKKLGKAGVEKETVQHAVGSAGQAQSVLDGINPIYFNEKSWFGKGFYVGNDPDTIIAELAEHGNTAKYAINYDLNLTGEKVLDLTNPQIASDWNFIQNHTSLEGCQAIGEVARAQGYSVIKVQSYRGGGINYVIFDNFDEILTPRIVVPVE